ncbi:hypothetical protein EON83_29145 [bacterium]|nr:MAG: hypothetical protein EON83_29145 [bacterium]
MDTPSKRQTLWLLLAAHLATGLVAGLFMEGSEGQRLWTIVSFIITIVLCMRWFALDARLHAYRISGPMFLCLVALLGFTAPFYFFATRRFDFWKSFLKSTLFFVILAIVSGVGASISQSIMATRR